MVTMRMRLYYQQTGTLLDTPANQGFQLEEIRALLKQLEAQGVQLELVDTGNLSDEARMQAYLEAAMPAIRRKYRVQRVFGSKRFSGRYFGKEVPALVVYEEEDRPPLDIYPHNKEGRVVTIREFLEHLVQGKVRQLEALRAAAGMDELRARIGPIGCKVSELIQERRQR